MRHAVFLAVLVLSKMLLVPAAVAGEIPCSPVEEGTIQVDGLLGDWKGASGVVVEEASQVVRGQDEWSGAQDLSFELFCNHEDRVLYLAVNVKDEYFIRSRAPAGDDHLEILLPQARILVWPGDLRGIKGQIKWLGKGRPRRGRGVVMAEALQRGGYSVELAIPMHLIAGYRPGGPSFPGAVLVADSDSKALGKIQTLIGTAPSAREGSFSFAQARANMTAFLKDKGYSLSQVRATYNLDVVGDSRVEQVLLVERTVGIVGDGLPGGSYFYMDMAVRRPQDIYWLKPMDLNGDGKSELVTRYVERSGNGRREILAVFRFNEANQFVRSFAHEILKGQGSSLIINRFSFKPRKGRRARGVDLLFDNPEARGFTQETYKEVTAQDLIPILLPWDEEKKQHYRFEGDEFSQL